MLRVINRVAWLFAMVGGLCASLVAEKQPSLQFTTPAELAELVVFLCSPAAQNVRGVAWQVDGGWTAQ